MIEIPAQKPLSAFNVLIIDGQSLVHEVVKSALYELRVTNVKSAENAFFALRLCEFTRFDLVLIAFDVKSDKDGFNLLEEMKFKGYITRTTSVIFLSADTSAALVNCVVELEPNDFWVKPLDKQKIEKRLRHIIEIKRKLYRLNYCIDKGEYATAIYYAQRQLQDPSLEHYHAQINRVIGDALFHLMEYSDAEDFYRELSKKYSYAWVQVGLVRTLLRQDKFEEGMALAEKLMERDDTRFTTYDAMAEYYIEKEDYEKGYEIIQKATELAPRNIDRNKKSWNLARLNHDRKGQYLACQNMMKFARNSIHDTPDLSVNVVRAAIDLASTLSDQEAERLLTRTEKDIDRLENEYGGRGQLGEQMDIIRARLCNVRKDKKGAEEIMTKYAEVRPKPSIEDNLDKVKAFHEVGMWEQSLKLLDQIKDQIEDDSFTSQVITEYLEQESRERKDIHYSPKELGEMASVHYKNKRYAPAFRNLVQAMQLAPSNVNMAISLMKVLAIIAEESGLDEEQQEHYDKTAKMLRESMLAESQQTRFDEYTKRVEAVAKADA